VGKLSTAPWRLPPGPVRGRDPHAMPATLATLTRAERITLTQGGTDLMHGVQALTARMSGNDMSSNLTSSVTSYKDQNIVAARFSIPPSSSVSSAWRSLLSNPTYDRKERKKLRHTGNGGWEIPDGIHNESFNHKQEWEEESHEALEVSPALDRRITRRFHTHIVPWLFGLWPLAFIDRSDIGNARIDGLTTDLKLAGIKFNVALTVFYVPYILIDVPRNWFLKYCGAGYYLPGLLVGWRIDGTCVGSVKSYGGPIAARFFLELCEGGL